MTANMYRFRVNLDGWQGAPGLNTLYFRFSALPITEDVQGVADLIRTAYDSIKSYLVSGVVVTISSEVDVIRDTDGVLQSSAVITPPAAVTGTATGANLSRGTMVVAKFNTDSVINGRRLRGRNFVGPVAENALQSNGQVVAAAGAAITSMYDGLLDVAGGRLVVWHRPSAPGAADGDSGFVQSVTYKSAPGNLSSRRD